MSCGWQGRKVRLVPLDKGKHFDNALQWLGDPEVTQWTLIGDFPISHLAEEEFFDRMMRGDPNDVVFAVETLDGEHVGMTGIHRIDWRQQVGNTGTLIGRKDLWGRGYGSDAIQVRTRYAFDVLGLRMLLSEALADNVASQKALWKAGYREVGRIPNRYWKRGAYRDVVLLMVDSDSWKGSGQSDKRA